jgi:cation:H+ antiporter
LSARQAVSDLSIGNVLGANVANLTFIVGAAALIRDVTMDRLTQMFNFPAMLVLMSLLVWMMSTDRRVSRREGVILLSAYALHVAALIGITLWVG